MSSTLESAGCTLQTFEGVSRAHTGNPALRPKAWNSFPPTSGPHYVTRPPSTASTASRSSWPGSCTGSSTAASTCSTGPARPPTPSNACATSTTATHGGSWSRPLPALGKTIALGAWTSENPGSAEVGTGHLARCTSLDTGAVQAFIDAYRGRGPEGAPLDALQPGGT